MGFADGIRAYALQGWTLQMMEIHADGLIINERWERMMMMATARRMKRVKMKAMRWGCLDEEEGRVGGHLLPTGWLLVSDF